MYRLLIVDDEPLIAEGLVELFQSMDNLDLDIYRAHHAAGALAITTQLRMDIVLTDIEMPRMNGIELAAEISRQWPKCRTIFLTGYNNFSYIQSSIRTGAIDYVLKTEGDEPIIAAVSKAIEQIAEEWNYDRLIDKAGLQLAAALPSLRKDYLLELLQGEPTSRKTRESAFNDLQVPLQPDQSVLLIAGRVDQWRGDLKQGDKALFHFSIHNIAEEYFSHSFQSVHVTLDPERFLWLIQPKSAMEGDEQQTVPLPNLSTYVLGLVETIQSSCKQYLKLQCSFVVSSEPCAWEQLPERMERLNLTFIRGLGLDTEMLLTERPSVEDGTQDVSIKVKRIQLLEQYLEHRDRTKFFQLYEDVMAAIQPSMQSGLALEVQYRLGAIFMSYMNRSGQLQYFAEILPLGKLFTMRELGSWSEVTHYFRSLAEVIFASKQSENDYESDEIVRRVHEYVSANLDKDLSLNRLADLVFLAPFYFSRLYKSKTGTSITDYIAELRIQKAKQLLLETSHKVADIGVMLGYFSPPYFTRFFKKATQLTPQEYRDTVKMSLSGTAAPDNSTTKGDDEW
ncbi:response regulator [Paenibacillus sp. LMG 31461]|uniref:Response regulator n=1 Tax=Paenibacillus plantarum TaxID=2654975 RepID=A0ABX1XKR1_9BACL|nr:response regulator [Paenibacillus plantarum]NOU68874.1 response regulator [Paenibacillus plantarum]